MAKAYLSRKELNDFKRVLEEKKDQIQKEIDKFIRLKMDRDAFHKKGDLADLADEEIDEGVRFRILDKHKKLLKEIDRALLKFKNKTYGICEGSGDYISKKRLKIRPWTKYSIEYKEYLDEEKRRQH